MEHRNKRGTPFLLEYSIFAATPQGIDVPVDVLEIERFETYLIHEKYGKRHEPEYRTRGNVVTMRISPCFAPEPGGYRLVVRGEYGCGLVHVNPHAFFVTEHSEGECMPRRGMKKVLMAVNIGVKCECGVKISAKEGNILTCEPDGLYAACSGGEVVPPVAEPGAFDTFTCSLGNKVLNVGEPIPAGTSFSWTRRGSYKEESTEFASGNTIFLQDSNETYFMLGASFPGLNAPGSVIFEIKAQDELGNTFSKSLSIPFRKPELVLPVRYGCSEDGDGLWGDQILALSLKQVTPPGKDVVYEFPAQNYKYIYFPGEFMDLGNPIFKDTQTGFEVPFEYLTAVEADGIEYYEFRSVYPIVGALKLKVEFIPD